LARWGWGGGGWGGAWWGKAAWSSGVATGLRVGCGHRRGTHRRVDVTDLSEAETKADGDGTALFAARKLGRGVNSWRRERFFAKKFIGRVRCRRGSVRSGTRWRFRRTERRAWCLLLILLLVEFAQATSRVRTNRLGVRRQVPFDQPSCQEGIAVLVHPGIEQLHDFLSHIGRQIQSRHLERLQRGFRRRQEKFPIHFLLEMLSQGAS